MRAFLFEKYNYLFSGGLEGELVAAFDLLATWSVQ